MAADPTADRMLRRFNELEGGRQTTEETWQQIADHMLGLRDFQTIRTPGEDRMVTIYDATARVSGLLLAGALHALLSSPATRWFRLAFEDPRLQDVPEFARWLSVAEDRLAAAMTRPEANFHAQMSEVYTELVFFGTAAVFVEDIPGQNRVRFSTRPLQEMFIAEDASGSIDTVFRRFTWTARQAIERLGKLAPEKAFRSQEKSVGEEKCHFLHAIFPNRDQTMGRMGRIGMPWQSVLISVDESRTISHGGFREMPVAVPRWQKEPWEVYGRGPGWTALPDTKMLNEMKRVTLKMGQRAVDPPLLVDHEGVLPTDLHLDPGGITPVNAVQSVLSPPIQPLPNGSDFRITDALIGDTRRQVQDAFHHQLVQLIRDPNMTATQVLELSSQIQRHMAPILGRLQTELLEPIIERVFAIEARAGRLPAAPVGISESELRIDYISPIARSQKSSDAQAIVNFFTIAANLSQVDPGVLDIIDADAGMREIGQALGVPPSVLRTSDEVAQRRAAAAANAEEQAELQQALAMTKALQQGTQAAKTAAEITPTAEPATETALREAA